MDLDLLLPQPPAPRDSWRWGTVTATSPLRVRLDGDVTALTATPDSLAAAYVGDRVWCQITGRRVIIHGSTRAGRVPGVIEMYAGPTVQPGKLMCDGSAVLRVGFPALFAAIGTTYGVGNGSTTFNLPQMSGRMPIGPSGAGYPLGGIGGESAHVLTMTEMPAHNHGISLRNEEVGSGSNPGLITGSGLTMYVNSGKIYAPMTVVHDAGGGAAHNNMPPFLVVNFTINT